MSPEESEGDGAPEPDDARNGPPPDPLDRPWVHPSELRSFVSTPDLPPREARPREWVIGLSSALAAVVVTILVLVAFGALGGRHRSALPPPVVTSPGDVVDYNVAERVGTAVAASVVTVRARTDDGGTRAVGSGVVTSSDRVVTAAHNLNGASDFVVVANNGRQYNAKVLGTDPVTDLALLSVSDGDFQLARLGSSTARVGQPVVAISAGPHRRVDINVVSDRDVMVDAGTGIDVAGLLETGIPITPDMSGGALVDPGGNLVGILTRAAGGTPDGLAIPVSVVRDVQDQLEGSGKAEHGWIGVVCDKDPADSPAQGGATVRVVMDGSPAANAGLQPDDVIVRAAGRIVTGRPDLVAAVRSLRPQDPLEVQWKRGTQTHTKMVTVKAAGDPAVLAFPGMG